MTTTTSTTALATAFKRGIPQDYAPAGYLTSQQYAARRGISDLTARSERARGISPVPWSLFLGKKPIYRERDVSAFLKAKAEKAEAVAAELRRRAAESGAHQ